ncbi:MAG: tetratricopeptide repeat protein, partial [Actinomycetota bacterium]
AAVSSGRDGRMLVEEMRSQFAFLDRIPDISAMTSYAYWLHQWSVIEPSAGREAVAWYERALDLDPFNPALRTQLAEAHLLAGRPEEAKAVLDPVIGFIERHGVEFGKEHPSLWATRALAHHALGEATAARAALADAFARSGLQLECHVNVASHVIDPEGRAAAARRRVNLISLPFQCSRAMLALLPDGARPG